MKSRGYYSLFLFSLAACLLCTDTTGKLSFHSLTAPVLTAFLLSYPTSFLPVSLRKIVQLLLGELLFLVCLVDLYCQLYFGSSLSPQILSNIILSDQREMLEFFSTFVGFYVIKQWRIAVILLLAILYPVSLLLKWPWPVKKSKVTGIAGIVGLVFCIVCELPPAYRYVQLFIQPRNIKNIEGLIFRHYHEEEPTPLHRLAFAYYASTQSAHVLDEIKRATYAAETDSCSFLSPHLVLVIGESYNKHHSSLYGYELPTTPLQQKRMEAGELFPFTDVVTPWNITSNAFLDIFSIWEYGNAKPVGDYPLFPILFRHSGFSVAFFSNQYLLKGFRRGATNQSGHFFLADGELSNSLFSYRNKQSAQFDLQLIEQVSDYKEGRPPFTPTLDIVHLIGQHFDYPERYPSEQGVFSLKDYAGRTLDNEAMQLVMHYDNATRYNDVVLDSLLSLYEDEEAVVLFIADHGEEVYDELPVHGRLFQDPTAQQARQEFEVPMWIWCSDSYRINHPDVMLRLQESLHKPFSTDGVPQILLSLAGISCKWTEKKLNVLSPDYLIRPRIIAGSVDYDRLIGSVGK